MSENTQQRTVKTFGQATQNERQRAVEMLSYWLAESTGRRLPINIATEFIGKHIQDDFVLGPVSVANLLTTIGQAEQLNQSADYIAQMNDQQNFRNRFENYSRERNASSIGIDSHIPKDIMMQIRPYIKQPRRLEMDAVFVNAQPKPGEDHLTISRMRQILTYLNDNRIAFTLSVDARNSSKIIATLEEYGGAIVDIYSPDPRDIGRVNTFNTIYSVDTYPDGPGTPQNPNAALNHRAYDVLDTLLNPGAVVQSVNVIQGNANTGRANTAKMKRDSLNLNIFATNIPNATSRIDSRIKQLEQFSRTSTDMVDLSQSDENTSNTFSDEELQNITESYLNSNETTEEGSIIKKPKQLDMLKARYNAKYQPANVNDEVANKIAESLERYGMIIQGININDEGVYEYQWINLNEHTQENIDNGEITVRKAYIGGIRELSENGTYPLKYQGETYGTFVPGLRGYIDSKTGELRVKSFQEIFDERLHQLIADQMTNMSMRDSAEAFTAFDTLYSAGAYGVTIQTGINTPEIEDVLIKTLKKRVRMPSELIDAATTGNDERAVQTQFINKVDEYMQSKSIRVIPEEMYPYVDPLITSIGKNQGGVLYLGSETTWDENGRLIAGEGVTHAISDIRKLPYFEEANMHDPIDRIIMSGTQALRNVPIVDANIGVFEFGAHDVNDPFIVSKAYAEKVHVAGHDGKNRPLKVGDKITDFHGNKGLVTIIIDPDDRSVKFPDDLSLIKWEIQSDGLTQEQYNYLRTIYPTLPETNMFDPNLPEDQYDYNIVKDIKNQIKSVSVDINNFDTSIVKLKVTNPDELTYSEQNLDDILTVKNANQLSPEELAYINSNHFYDNNYIREREIFNQNRELEVLVAPFSLLSRANMGLPVEMQKNHVKMMNDVQLPDGSTIPMNHVSIGNISMMISDMDVDYKTSIYDRESYEKKGKGRKLSHQLIMGMQAAGMNKTLEHVFQDQRMNAEGWGIAIDNMRMLGYDIDMQGKLGRIDMGTIYDRLDAGDPTIHVIHPLAFSDREGKMKPVKTMSFKDQIALATKVKGAKDVFLALPVPVTLRSGVQTTFIRIPTEQFEAAEKLQEFTEGQTSTGLAGQHGSIFMNHFNRIYDACQQPNAVTKVPELIKSLDSAIVAREFSKDKNVIKTKVFNATLPQSATAPMTNRPTGRPDTVYVSPEIYKNLEIDESAGPYVLVWRDPILDTGGFVAMKVEVDEELTGCAIHYSNDEAMKADRDGDSLAIWRSNDPNVQREWEEKASREWRLGDPLRNQNDFKSSLTQGLNLDAGLALLGNEGKAMKKEFNSPETNLDRLNEIYQIATRQNHSFGQYGIDTRTNQALMQGLEKIVHSGAKGSMSSLGMVNHFLHGDQRDQETIDIDNRAWMYALGGKVDFVGPAGAIQQRLVKYMRNFDLEAAMFVSAQATQGALQVKHDPEKARIIGNLLRKDIPNIFDGIDRHENRGAKDPKRLTAQEFIRQANEIYNVELGVNLGTELIERVAKDLSDSNGMIMDKKQLALKADPLDLIAYGGITDFTEAARQNMVVGNGKSSYMFKPPVELAADSVLDKYAHQRIPEKNYIKTFDEIFAETTQFKAYKKELANQKRKDKNLTEGSRTFNIYDDAIKISKDTSNVTMQEDNFNHVTPKQPIYIAPSYEEQLQQRFPDQPAFVSQNPQPEMEQHVEPEIPSHIPEHYGYSEYTPINQGFDPQQAADDLFANVVEPPRQPRQPQQDMHFDM